MKKLFARIRHNLYKILIRIINFPQPRIITGYNSSGSIYKLLSDQNIDNVLVVTDNGIIDAGLTGPMLAGFDANNIKYAIYDRVKPDPGISDIEEGIKLYTQNKCRGIIAFGGGSPIDCAKVIAARAASKKPVRALKGSFKVRGKLPFLAAVPTTAGTGSETTIFSVISDREKEEKFTITDPKLTPDACILDPALIVNLPPHLTAYTGMDALTHAVESYLSIIGTSFSDQKALEATNLIFNNLEESYRDGSNLESRKAMLEAAHFAGLAFTRAIIGYAHAAAHNLGAVYGIQHGLANAVVLPVVLEYSRDTCTARMAELAVHGGLGTGSENESDLGGRLIEKIRQINAAMSIPSTIKELKEEDIPYLAEKIDQEANPAYPVPKLLQKKDLEKLLYDLLE